jgi:hypothetical protein
MPPVIKEFKMKKILLILLMACSNSAFSQTTAASFDTAEYYKSRALVPVHADQTWAKGYTGAGSIIAILDTGIDSTNTDFQGKIIASKDFSGSGTIIDTNGHGTEVAGIAAAAQNNIGTEGVAPGANLVIAKISSNGIVLSSTALSGLQWANTTGAIVANLSVNSTLTAASIGAKLIAPGIYSTNFTNTTNLVGGINPNQWAAAMPNDMVLVIAAGNDGTPWSGGWSQIATATNISGSLILGGRVIIAGNWNEQTNSGPGAGNNGAATLCQVVVSGVCQDKYQAWQFYLMAPGVGITTTAPLAVNSLRLATVSGTSFAAPTISGAVAIIHQEWPQMTAANIVQLLLMTANKNIPGYNPYIDGQGLLDLNAATQPIGSLGIPTTKSMLGRRATSIQPVLITSGSAGTANLKPLMILDSFNRDYYINSKILTASITAPNDYNVMQNSLPYFTGNTYTLFNNYSNYLKFTREDSSVTWYFNSQNTSLDSPAMAEIAVKKHYKLFDVDYSTGAFSEHQTWLGNWFYGNNNTSNTDSVTHFYRAQLQKSFENNIKLFGGIGQGVTFTKSNSPIINAVGPALSWTWNVGIEKTFKNGSVGVMSYTPVNVWHAHAAFNSPVGLDKNFDVVQNSQGDLAATVHEYRTGAYFKINDQKTVNMLAFIEHRRNFQGQSDITDNAVGLVVTKHF